MAPSNASPPINLFISFLWLAFCLLVMLAMSFMENNRPFEVATSLLCFLLSLPASAGLYWWRGYSLKLTGDTQPQSATKDLGLQPKPLEQRRIIGSLSPITSLTWLTQSLATLCLIILILTALRPLPLAGFIAIALLAMEVVLFAEFISSSTLNSLALSTALSRPSSLDITSTDPRPNPCTETSVQANVHATSDSNSSVEETFTEDPNYQNLLALREQIEQTGDSDLTSLETSSASQDFSEPPRQSIRDFRDTAGFGTISGETQVAISPAEPTTIVTVAFMPPFPTKPELLADCEDERVDSVRVLQCQPLGAKIEIRLVPDLEGEHEVALFWEATLEK